MNWTEQLISDDILNLVGSFYNTPINGVEFKCHQIDCEIYQIHVIFKGPETRRSLTFSKIHTNNLDIHNHIDVDDYTHFVSDLSKAGANVMDLWPLNGTIKPKQFLKNALKGELRYLDELSKLFKFKKKHRDLVQNSLKVMVLDLKDKTTNYRNKERITKHEIEIGGFFHKNNANKIKKRAKKQLSIYNLVREFNIDYIFREGSLKHDLLYDSNLFNAQEIAYFDSYEGSRELCQLCELIMNAFKTLYQVEIGGENKSYIFHPRDYIIHIPSLENKSESIKVSKLQNMESSLDGIALITYYPQCYLHVYSKDKPYYECISKFDGIQVKHDVFDDFSNITCIQIEHQNTVKNTLLGLNDLHMLASSRTM